MCNVKKVHSTFYHHKFTSHIIFLNSSQNWQQAHKDATQALELDSNDAEAYTARATALFQNGNFEQASTDFEAALNFAPSDVNQVGTVPVLVDRMYEYTMLFSAHFLCNVLSF